MVVNIREAILRAADSIEQNPSLFNWNSCSIAAPDCGTPGCALGWIAHHVGASVQAPDNTARWGWSALAAAMGTGGDSDFYGRMNDLRSFDDWTKNALVCAKTLRAYADKHHPNSTAKHTGLPACVRQIFEGEAA